MAGVPTYGELSQPQHAAVAALVAGTYAGNLTITGNLQVDGTTLLQSTTTVAGVAKFADGAVGAPSVTFATDLTAGLYHTGTGATGSILAAINGVNKLALTATGLGVLTSAPAGALSVLSSNVSAIGAAWSAEFSLFGPNSNSTAGAALGIGFSDTTGAHFVSIAPGVAWKSLTVSCSTFSVKSAGSAQGLYQDGSGLVGVGQALPSAKLDILQTAATSGLPKAFRLTSAAHTGLTSTAEDIGVLFDLSATKTWAAGNIATQREFVINAPTYAFASASTFASAATVYISGAPIAGANATITTRGALLVNAGSIVCQGAALATDAAEGFLYIPTCAGTPTGTPQGHVGTVPLVYDTTNHKLYVYDGSWIGGAAPGAWS